MVKIAEKDKIFDGINRKCRLCKNGCKQFEQVVVVFCPDFSKVKGFEGKA
jgi:hypothetical protein